jgi:isopenicillin-N N-acyltransferase-like protein
LARFGVGLKVPAMDQYLPVIKIRGSAQARGQQQGSLLKDRIQKTVDYYRAQFLQPEEEILEIAGVFRRATRAAREDLSIEIESMASAAGIDPLWLYALNGRTELLSLNPMECTSLAFRQLGLIGQNWDWDAEAEELAVILDIEREDNHRIVTMTEPGMIAKIGMNNHGIGVCLNFMSIKNYQPYGIPQHVLLRMILDSRSMQQALSQITPHLRGKVGNIVIMASDGEIRDIELAGDEFFLIPVGDRFVHTNHFLTKVDYDAHLFPSTFGRHRRATELLNGSTQPSVKMMKAILKDRGDENYPICRKRFSHTLLSDDTSITVCTIVMDLKNLQFHITQGNPFDHPFSVFSLKSPSFPIGDGRRSRQIGP